MKSAEIPAFIKNMALRVGNMTTEKLNIKNAMILRIL